MNGFRLRGGRRSPDCCISSFGIQNTLNQAMDSRFRGNDVISARHVTFALAVWSSFPRKRESTSVSESRNSNGKFRYFLRSNPGAGSGNDRLKTIVGAWRKAYRTARRSDRRGGWHEPIPVPGRAAIPRSRRRSDAEEGGMSRFQLREGWRSPNCCINGKFRYSLRSNPGAGSGKDRHSRESGNPETFVIEVDSRYPLSRAQASRE